MNSVRMCGAGTNHFGHFALTRDILPSMKALVSITHSFADHGTVYVHAVAWPYRWSIPDAEMEYKVTAHHAICMPLRLLS